MEYNIQELNNWLANNTTLSAAFSTRSLRILVAHILKGRNYRLITERNTKDKLIITYVWLLDIYRNAREKWGNGWKEGLLADLQGIKRKTPEQKNLQIWLLGLPQKTVTNLGVKRTLEQHLKETDESVTGMLREIGRPREDIDIAWLMLMGGAATLTIRGSDKSKVGKRVEKLLAKSALTILGFTLDENFWMNIERDAEVERETDAEVATKRGRLRIEVGLIEAGNQEVIEDKIGRVGQNGIILFDRIGPKSNIHQTAANRQVNLIQIRDGQPLVDLHRILGPVATIKLNDPPKTEEEIDRAVAELPDEFFNIGNIAEELGEETDEEIGDDESDDNDLEEPKQPIVEDPDK